MHTIDQHWSSSKYYKQFCILNVHKNESNSWRVHVNVLHKKQQQQKNNPEIKAQSLHFDQILINYKKKFFVCQFYDTKSVHVLCLALFEQRRNQK